MEQTEMVALRETIREIVADCYSKYSDWQTFNVFVSEEKVEIQFNTEWPYLGSHFFNEFLDDVYNKIEIPLKEAGYTVKEKTIFFYSYMYWRFWKPEFVKQKKKK